MTTSATLASGTYTGGAGGNASGFGFDLSGGGGGTGLYAPDDNVTITGGAFDGGPNAVGAGVQYGVLSVSNNPGDGADFYYSTVNVYGGTFTAGTELHESAGLGVGINATDSTVNLYGSNFRLNGVAVGYGPLTTMSSGSTGTITGLLADNGTTTSITFSGGAINLLPVPEPTAALLLAVALPAVLGGRRSRAGRPRVERSAAKGNSASDRS